MRGKIVCRSEPMLPSGENWQSLLHAAAFRNRRWSKIFAVLFTLTIFAAISQAQPLSKVPRIARLSPSSAAADEIMLAGFRLGLKEHGWIENKNIMLEYRFADCKTDRLNELAAELVHLKVDVILSGATVGAQAAKRATSTIPIVLVQPATRSPRAWSRVWRAQAAISPE